MKRKSLSILCIAGLTAATSVQADTINFNGGNLATASNWDGGVKPGAGDVGTINVNGTLNIGNVLGGWITGDPELIIDNGAVITCSGDWGHVNALSSTFNDSTLTVGDDIFANSSLIIFNAGSAATTNDDFEANGSGTLTINGGTHTAGDYFGAQNNSSTLNVFGGTVSAATFRVDAAGFMNIGGGAVLSGGNGGLGTSKLEGAIDILSTWTGSWTISTLTGTDWETEVTGGDWTLDSTTIDATVFANSFEVINGGATLQLIAPPSPPSLVTTSPGNGDMDVPTTSTLVITFDEDIALGATGDVTIKNLTTPSDIVISLPGPDADGALSVSGSELTIAPAAALVAGDQYAIQIGGTVVEDLEGNAYAGFSDDTTWSFTTDGTAPLLVSTVPVEDAIDVNPGTDLVATFDEDIVLGATGTITIKNLTNPSDTVITLPGTDPDGTLSIAGMVLTIDPAVDLVAGDEYAIEISSDAIENLSGLAYAGLLETDVPNWSFTTDGTSPALVSTNPIDDASNVFTGTNLVATFDEDIVLGSTGTITIKNLTTPSDIEITLPGPDPDGTLAVAGAVLTIDPALDLAGGDEYAIEISNTAIEDLYGNTYGGILSTDDPNWSFTTDGTPPSSIGMGPIAGASEVAVFSSLSLTFDEDVQIATGTVTLHLVSDDSEVEAIDVTTGDVSIVGGKVTINPSSDLANGTAYYVTITDGAFTDPSGNAYAGISDPAAWTFSTESGNKILFADTFNRADGTDLNASTDGKSGALAPLDWVKVLTFAAPFIQDNEFNLGETGAGGGFTVAYPDHNFTDAAITIGSGFNVSVDLVNAASTGGTRFMGVAVGNSKSELDAWTSNNPATFTSDFFIGIDPSGTAELKVFTNGTEAFQTGFTLNGSQTLDVEFSVTDFNTDSTVGYEAFVDGASIHSGTFTWSGTDENYIALYSNYTQNQAIMDNFAVRANVEILTDLVLEISQVGANLAFEWNSMSGMQYDLLTSTDLSTPISSWLPYNDGVTTYEDIASTGTGTQTLSGVLKVGPTRFFALLEEELQPLFSEDFEGGNGGFTTTKTAGTDWVHGDPDSAGFGGQTVTTGNGGSTYCWGTNISNPGYYVNPTTDTCLRSTVIDLTGVAAAELTFAQAIDLDSGDTVTVNIIDDTTDMVILENIFTIADGNLATSDWEQVGPIAIPALALGQPVRIEWCLSGTGGDTADYMGWYIDDVNVTPTTP